MSRRALFLLIFFLGLVGASGAQKGPDKPWRFAVSGDSRNCGDVVMPAISRSVLAHDVEFYWHLGDFRVGYAIDEDMQDRSSGKLSLEEYLRTAWDDFLTNQIDPFDPLTVHLGIGNHELYLHGATKEDERLSHSEFIAKFKKGLAGSKTAYYRWKLRPVDFINLDNSFNDGFEEDQMAWLETVLKEDRSDDDVHAIVVGMHRALPNSLACGHSMNGDPSSPAEDNLKSLTSGRRTYENLWDFQRTTRKPVYVLASHSHLYMEDIFNTAYWNNKNERDKAILDKGKEKEGRTLKGWLVGTAGAKRYRLPDNLPPDSPAISYAYGYLLATVSPDGTIQFEFKQITEDDVPTNVWGKFSRKFVDSCFLANRDDTVHPPEQSCNER
jgi:hypothetical protein